MTNIIEVATTPARNLVTPTSRYYNRKVIYYGEQKFLTFETYIKKSYQPEGNEQVMLITKGIEYRPDLVSYQVYGYPDSWWKIMEANNIKDIYDFKAGKTIMIPNVSL